jgi:hypothetical protein
MSNQQKVVMWMGVAFTLIGMGTVSVYVYNKFKDKK